MMENLKVAKTARDPRGQNMTFPNQKQRKTKRKVSQNVAQCPETHGEAIWSLRMLLRS